MKLTAKEYVELCKAKAKKKNKYGVGAIEERTYNGIIFDSIREMKRYKLLSFLESKGEIKDLQIQVVFEFTDLKYIADFVYYRHGQKVVEDCKGFKTPEYKRKKRLMKEYFGINILET